MNTLLELYKRWSGQAPHKVESLPRAGSNRQYIRLFAENGSSVIGVIGTSTEENRCFVYLSNHFTSKGLPMPRIYAFSNDETCYIQQDLGCHALYDALAPARNNNYTYTETERTLLARCIRMLAHIQVTGAADLDFNLCLEPRDFNRQAAMFDLNYFKYSFLKTTDIAFDEVKLEKDLVSFADNLVGDLHEEHYFLYRDFQARNIMICDTNNPYFIDFQGGMRGPLEYDVASFLWQASARYPQALREHLINEYVEELKLLLPQFNETEFHRRLQLFVLFRILQVLGAYGLRGYVERKKYFLDSIPLAIQNLRRMLIEGVVSPYPYLCDVLHRMVDLPQFNLPADSRRLIHNSQRNKAELTVRVFSFSYKKGIPEDKSGNGGGYVFDCRSTHNPGRYEPYKKLTGRDKEVIKFLEDDGEILPFLDAVYKLADAHIKRYIEREFTSLMFCFGCTGGQHRSVYSAEHLAQHIHQKFGVKVIVCHREQNITYTLETD